MGVNDFVLTCERHNKELNADLDYYRRQNARLKNELNKYKETNKELSNILTQNTIVKQDNILTIYGVPLTDIPKLIARHKYLENKVEEYKAVIMQIFQKTK